MLLKNGAELPGVADVTPRSQLLDLLLLLIGTKCISSALLGEKRMFGGVARSSLLFSWSWSTLVVKAGLVAPWRITSSSMYDVANSVVDLCTG